jgi:hypothetical protein
MIFPAIVGHPIRSDRFTTIGALVRYLIDETARIIAKTILLIVSGGADRLSAVGADKMVGVEIPALDSCVLPGHNSPIAAGTNLLLSGNGH